MSINEISAHRTGQFAVKMLALLVLFVVAYWVPLIGTAHVWFTSEDYSYGFIIPIISAYLIWSRRDRLRGVTVKAFWPVLPLLLGGVALSLYAILGSSGNISRPLIPLLLLLFTLFCFGIDMLKELFFPLSFLIFMVPIPAFLERTLGVYLKSVSSRLGGGMISFFDIPVHVSGNVIDLGVSQLQVVDACNGIRYLFPLIALGFIYSHFFERVTWKKSVCVLATIPIAVLTNGLRIGVTGLLTNAIGPAAAEGFFHDFTGWVLFMVSFAFLVLLGRLLRLFPPHPQELPVASLPEKSETTISSGDTTCNTPLMISVVLLMMVGSLSLSTGALPPVKLKSGITAFPLAMSAWQGQQESVDPEVVKASGAEESFSANYQRGERETVSLYIGYRSSAFLENENFFHSPTVCLPSSGWSVLNTTTRTITGGAGFPRLRVSEMVIQNLDVRQVVYFWFQTRSRATPDKNINRFHLTLHAIQRDNTYDLFLRPITPVLPNESVEHAEQRLDGFVRDMMGALMPFLKENIQ